MTTAFLIPDASCGHCKSTIESAVSSLAGVSAVELDLESKRLSVEHGSGVDADQVRRPYRLEAIETSFAASRPTEWKFAVMGAKCRREVFVSIIKSLISRK
ncbi:MAG: cation transporter [Actinomycetota bacterium]|nr:cation transporter [Actinomycetota bacterium]